MERRVRRKVHARCEAGENPEIVSKDYLSLSTYRADLNRRHGWCSFFLYTKMRNVAGVSQAESQKSSDMYAKCRYMDELTGGKGITFATGTPISNSMSELYTIMRYLQQDQLEHLGFGHFDSWAAAFGETVTAIELSPEGKGYRAKTRFSRFFNLPELMAVFKECADIQTADMLRLPAPEAVYENVVLEPSRYQQEMIKSLADRAEMVRDGRVDATVDNMLSITNDGRKLALDQRLVNQALPDEHHSKINECVEKALSIWMGTMDKKSTQLIFCDMSTPKNDGTFNVYHDIRDKLVGKGVPQREIAFIHDANTEKKKAELFAKVRSGQVRFLLGSTSKMGAGTNVQDKLIAEHHLDVPWRPSDIEQREGRIIRQGNENGTVYIFRYITENTFDAYSWQVIENKQKFIGQVMTGKAPVRSCEDMDEAALSYAEVKALAIGNPLIKEKMDLDIQTAKLKLLKASHTSQTYRLEDNIMKNYPRQIAAAKENIASYETDIAAYKKKLQTEGDGFSIMVQGREYTDKKQGGEALLTACQLIKTPDAREETGAYMGFPMYALFDSFSRKYILHFQGKMRHMVELGTDKFGNLSRINHMFASMEDRLDKEKETLRNLEKQLESAREEVKKPFEKEKELSRLLKRLSEVNAMLDIGMNGREGLEETSGNEPDGKKNLSAVSPALRSLVESCQAAEGSIYYVAKNSMPWGMKKVLEEECHREGLSEYISFTDENYDAVCKQEILNVFGLLSDSPERPHGYRYDERTDQDKNREVQKNTLSLCP